MLKGSNSLAALVRDQLDQDPLSGDAFVFISQQRSTVKILTWDVSGWLCPVKWCKLSGDVGGGFESGKKRGPSSGVWHN
jgi:transposase